MAEYADGSGVLLCPVGEGFSTISDELYLRLIELEAEGYAEIVEVEPSIYQEWASNAKQIVVTNDSTTTFTGGGSITVSSTATFKQGRYVDGEIVFNNSEHPFPLNYFMPNNYGLGLSFRPVIFGEDTGVTDEFSYYDIEGPQDQEQEQEEGEEYVPPRPGLLYPRVFLRNDKFYWYKNKQPFLDGSYVETLTDTSLVANTEINIFGGHISTVRTTVITDQFY